MVRSGRLEDDGPDIEGKEDDEAEGEGDQGQGESLLRHDRMKMMNMGNSHEKVDDRGDEGNVHRAS